MLPFIIVRAGAQQDPRISILMCPSLLMLQCTIFVTNCTLKTHTNKQTSTQPVQLFSYSSKWQGNWPGAWGGGGGGGGVENTFKSIKHSSSGGRKYVQIYTRKYIQICTTLLQTLQAFSKPSQDKYNISIFMYHRLTVALLPWKRGFPLPPLPI